MERNQQNMVILQVDEGGAEAPPEAVQERRARILDAAEGCFVRAGFHRTTMQDVAAEAGMSPGNLYRYFRSKDAIVEGLAERDRSRVMADFSRLVDADDFLGSLAALAYRHFRDERREQAVLCLEIWSEATRNPTFANLTDDFDRDVLGRLTFLFRQAQERGAIDPGVEAQALATVVATLANGLFVRRAVSRSFDAEREVGYMLSVIEAAFAGRIQLGSGQSDGSRETVS